ncbi:MAG TPA: transketolase [Candidatus Paceibacterota bacterium]|jgi:transketolase
MPLHEDKLKSLEKKANEIRQTLIEMLTEAGSGHTAGPLGMADIFTAFYFHILNHDPEKPDWEERDRLILSNGHITPIRYAAMAHAGYFPLAEAKTLRKFGSRLQGHPEREKLPAVETTSGPLGSGLSQAAGIAYGARMDDKKFRVYCLLSDAEHQAGNLWEGAMFAGVNKLANLTAVIDRNNIQINGMTEDVMPLEPLRAKYEAFNWHVLEVDGHNIEAFSDAVDEAKAIYEKPTVIIAHTIPGKGVDFIEFDYRWHGDPLGKKDVPGDPPKEKQAQEALTQLRTLGKKIEASDS